MKNRRFLILIITLSLVFIVGHSSSSPVSGRITANTLKYIDANYIEPQKVKPSELLQGAFDNLQTRIPEFEITKATSPVISATIEYASRRFKIPKYPTLRDVTILLSELYQFLRENYSGDLKPEEFEYIAIEGMLDKLDPHSNLLTPKIYKEFMIGTKGEFGGVGMVVGLKEGLLTVIAPLEGTPAYRAGILAGDRIVQISSESTVNISLTEAVNLLRGDIGTSVSVVIERGTRAEKHQFTLKRAAIHIDSVQSTLLTPTPQSRIGYIKLKNFQSDTDKNVTDALKKLVSKGELTGLILDLRNNAGGLLDQAAKIVDHFITSGTIVSTVSTGNLLQEKEEAKKDGTEPLYSIIVLINEGSASASEIVAKTLQDYKRALIIGQNSFGKGSVQTIFDLGTDCALKLTVAKYLAAGRIPIESYGITPDIELLPLRTEKDEVDLLPNEKQNEFDLLEPKLSKSKKEKEKAPSPQYILPFLDTSPKKDLENNRKDEYSKEPQLQNDIAVKIAEKLLSRERNENLANSIKRILKEEDDKLIEKLAKIGIDWVVPSSGSPSKPELEISFNILKGSDRKTTVTAGEEIELEVVAKNTSKEKAYRLIANSSSENPIFNDLEFIFGKLEPYSQRSWKTKVKVPASVPQQEVVMDINFEYGSPSREAGKLGAQIPIIASQKPSFAFSYKLKGRTNDGGIPKNKNLSLMTTILNNGQGESSDQTISTLSTDDGDSIFIQTGRVKIPPLKPGSKKTVEFQFHVQPSPKDKVTVMDLTAFDGKQFIALEEKLKINLETGTIVPPESRTYAPPHIELSAPPKVTDSPTISLKGVIKDDEAVKDYYLFEGSKKIYYKAETEPSRETTFVIEVPLEKGNNALTLIARDQYNLSSSKSFVIRYSEAN